MVSFILPGNSATGGYEVANSCRFDSASSDRLNRTLGTPTNNYKWTYSFWVKRSTYSSIYGEQVITSPRFNGSFEGKIKFNSDDSFEIYDYRNSFLLQKKTNRLFRDTNAW